MNVNFPSCGSTAMTFESCFSSSFSQFPLPNPISNGSTYCYSKINFKSKNLKTLNNHHYLYSHSHNLKIPCLQTNASAQVGAGILEDSTTKSGFENLVWPSPEDEVPFWKREFPLREIISGDSANIERDCDLMHVIHVTAEMAPIAKVGGLGDVVTGLARACLSRGHKVDIMLPFYECIQRQYINDLALINTYESFFEGQWIPTNAYRGEVSGIPVIFIEPSNLFFKGHQVYGGSYNELEAYLFFSRACLEWMQVTGTQPDIVHVHEWQTGALPLLYWDIYHYLSLKKPRLVLTIHNMEHYGECRQEQLSKCGLDGSIYATEDKAVDDRTIGHNPERLSLLKGGIVYSNAVVGIIHDNGKMVFLITVRQGKLLFFKVSKDLPLGKTRTVSRTYLKETLSSGWLASTLMRNRDKYFGILNGIDTAMWNPATDVFLPAKFDAYKVEGKKTCKHFLQRGLGLALEGPGLDCEFPHQVPLVVCISRLVAQKGLHLITHAIKRVEELGGQMVVLGKAPDGRVEREFECLANLYNQGSNIRILLMYSEELSHMLYAAADMVLVPSMYEPCGLAQMIGMRYGAVPIVRKTGGLADTVFDMDDGSQPEMANGFVFEGIDENSLNWALDRALSYYREKPSKWNATVQKVMTLDNSWNNTAGKYIDVYNSIRVRW